MILEIPELCFSVKTATGQSKIRPIIKAASNHGQIVIILDQILDIGFIIYN